MMGLRWILAICLGMAVTRGVAAEPLNAAALRAALGQTFDQHPTARQTTVALKVIDLETGETLFDRGGDRLLVPASNLKIYTSACALDVFGPEHRFKTTVRTGGRIVNGVLLGDLTLIGGGDAMLNSRDLATIAHRVVQELGMRQIAGRVIVDNSRYAPRLKGPGWMWDDEPDYYNMSVTPLMVDFNVLTVRLTPAKDGTTTAELMPKSSYPPLQRVESGAIPSTKIVTRQPFTEPIEWNGDAKIDKASDVRLTMHDPAPWVAGMFQQMLIDRGVAFLDASSESNKRPSDAEFVPRELVHVGPTLAETLKHFNHVSENGVGEVLLHEIAVARGVKQPGWPAGAKIISDWLVEKAGLQPGSFRLVDGSGLSRYNLISPDSSVRLLQYLQKSETFPVFFTSLPTSKVEGVATAGRLSGSGKSKTSCVSAKGGSMSSVSTVSGYLRTDDGRLLAFSLLVNGFIGSNEPVFDLRQAVWRKLVRYRGNAEKFDESP